MVETNGHFPGKKILHGAVNVIEGEYISHWEMSGAIYHVALHLADSVPTKELLSWREARKRGDTDLRTLYTERIERYLSSGHGLCPLKSPAIANPLLAILERDNGICYDLHAITIMPNHVHVVVSPIIGQSLKRTVDQWKSVSAHMISRQSEMKRPVWHKDFYSRIIRTPEEYARQIRYVWHNPTAAGLTAGFLRKRY